MANERFEALVSTARRTNAERDNADRAAGFAAPVDGGDLSMQLRTVLCALECGIEIEDWDSVAEGYAMLERLERITRQSAKQERT